MKTTKILMVTFLMSIFGAALVSYAQQSQNPKTTSEKKDLIRAETANQSLDQIDDRTAKLQEARKKLFADMEASLVKYEKYCEEMKAGASQARLETTPTRKPYQKYEDQQKEANKPAHKKINKEQASKS